MTQSAQFSIGIDLGTTNCALAFVDLTDPRSVSKALPIHQREESRTEIERFALPSFLAWEEGDLDWVPGTYALKRSRERPDSVVHSAKSWLCHHTVSSEAKILPWKSQTIGDSDKLSPIEASAKLLEAMKTAWDRAFGDRAPFSKQQLTITVPASFDAAAQASTLEAARLAGFPDSIRLLEEPQAAFYRFLEREDNPAWRSGQTVLVVDIGGGTSDFSLFRLGERDGRRVGIERIAVSDHLLLGGDNIDLALAHALESELAQDGEELSVDQWGFLIGRAREVKERCLGQSADDDEELAVSLPSRGSGLFAGTLSTEISSKQARDMLLEGFFPLCSKDAIAERAQSGLLEWGLPYAVDCAVTHHLAEFLKGKPRIDWVLFNGGSLQPVVLRERLLSQLAAWQEGAHPQELANSETDLAVASGAACYGALSFRGLRRIDAGVPRSLYIEVESEEGTRLVCVVPKGSAVDAMHRIEVPGLRLVLNRRSQFRLLQGGDDQSGKVGSVLEDWDESSFRTLPPLEAKAEWDAGGIESVAIRLKARVRETGVLEMSCETIGLGEASSWPLEFNLRGEFATKVSEAMTREESAPIGEGLRGKLRQCVRKGLAGAYGSASRTLKELERLAGKPKHEWDAAFSRFLADRCLEFAPDPAKPAVAERWLQLSGYFLRPGFGCVGDEERLARLCKLVADWGTMQLSAQVEVQWLILKRRVALGFGMDAQVWLFDEQEARLRLSKKGEAERIRLLGALESVDLARKRRLLQELLPRLEIGISEESYLTPVLAALRNLSSRVLLRAGPDKVLSPDDVEAVFKRLAKCDWNDARYAEAVPLFLAAARISDDRALDLPSRLQGKVLRKLEKSGVAAVRLLPLREFVPLGQSDQAGLFGESLPHGLMLQ